MESDVRFLVQGARARAAAARGGTPATPSTRAGARAGTGRHPAHRGASLTPDLLFLSPPTSLALSPTQALALRRARG